MAGVTCAKCGKGFTRTCSCQGNICPACKSAARAGARPAAQAVNGRRTAKESIVWKVTYADRRKATMHETAQAAADARAEARKAGVRTFMRTMRARS